MRGKRQTYSVAYSRANDVNGSFQVGGEMPVFRGSRKHVLDWTSQPNFVEELLELAAPVACRRLPKSLWMPKGRDDGIEARLETFGPLAMLDHPAWPALTKWWLRHPAHANTPNWDIALSCEVEGTPGLILVEAKANIPELGVAGKPQSMKASKNSMANHERIGRAIAEARAGLEPALPGISISRDSHYQLANRLAFSWKLATLGIPTVLLYLGFTGDEGIRDAGMPFDNDEHWQDVFGAHLKSVCPTAPLVGPVNVGAAPFWVLSRSRPVLEVSPPRP
jgi:hypothetical protein